MQDYKKLKVWEKSHQLCLNIYKLTRHFPDEEKYGLVAQLRRAAVSIPTNIVEGTGRESNKELVRFLNISMGSLVEVEYLIFLVKDLSIINEGQFTEINSNIVEIKKMLSGFIKTVKGNQ